MASGLSSLGGGHVAVGIAVLIIIAVHSIVKKRYFHPYSKVPGPFLASVTSLYSAYHSWRGTMHLDVQRCHRRYGDLIRYAPNQVLSLHTPDLAAIYGHGAPFRKAKGYETMIPIPGGWSTMTSIDKTLHHNLRRVFRSGLSTDNLQRFEPAILRHLKVYFGELQREKDADGWSVAADMRKWNLCLGFDTMADFGLGIETDLLRSSDRDFVFPTLYVHEKKMGLWEQLPIFSALGIGHVVALAFLAASAEARKFVRWYKRLLDQAITANVSESRGIFGPVIQSGSGTLKNPGHNYAQMIGEGAFSTFSSADAYGIVVSGFIHYLSQYPDVYEKLAVEMRSLYAPGEDITWNAALESNASLRAVINEVMRLLPPACGVHWRECEQSGFAIGPEGLPLVAGSDVGMSIFSLLRDGRIFRDPVRFWPERWIPGTLPEAEYSLAKKMFAPFLIGPRNCAGSHVAIMMGSIACAYILVYFDFRLEKRPHLQSPRVQANIRGEKGEDKELVFESHYSIAGWESGPFIQFKAR